MPGWWVTTRATETVLKQSTFSALNRAALVGALLLPVAVSAEDDPKSWLMRLNDASKQQSFDGTFVYRNGDWMESMRILQRVTDSGTRARLVALSGEAREVIRDDNRVTCILPESGAVLVSKKRPGVVSYSVFSPSREFGDHYTLGLAEGERVAGRETRLLSVTPRDEFRYGYRLYLDESTGLALRSELIAPGGQALEQIAFTSIRLPADIPDHLLEPSLQGQGFTWYTTDPPTQGGQNSSFSVGWLPPGFEMADRQTDPAVAGRMPVEHVVYTDGLTTISVFIEDLKANAEALKGPSSMGAMNAYGRMLDTYQVTVVGEVPGVTVENVARSVARR